MSSPRHPCPDPPFAIFASLRESFPPGHLFFSHTQEDLEVQAVRLALEFGQVKPGETVVTTAGLPLHVTGMTNAIKAIAVGP